MDKQNTVYPEIHCNIILTIIYVMTEYYSIRKRNEVHMTNTLKKLLSEKKPHKGHIPGIPNIQNKQIHRHEDNLW